MQFCDRTILFALGSLHINGVWCLQHASLLLKISTFATDYFLSNIINYAAGQIKKQATVTI